MTLYYFAYGSNLHPLRIKQRVSSVKFEQLVTVPGYQLHFHKRHEEDGSGKCNMFQTGNADDVVIGALYSMHDDHKAVLDQYEGPGYRSEILELNVTGQSTSCFVYIAERSHIDNQLLPFDWYRSLVLLGAKYHNLPVEYVQRIENFNSQQDPDAERKLKNEGLIEEMRSYRYTF